MGASSSRDVLIIDETQEKMTSRTQNYAEYIEDLREKERQEEAKSKTRSYSSEDLGDYYQDESFLDTYKYAIAFIVIIIIVLIVVLSMGFTMKWGKNNKKEYISYPDIRDTGYRSYHFS